MLSRWTQSNHKSPYTGEGSMRVRAREGDVTGERMEAQRREGPRLLA